MSKIEWIITLIFLMAFCVSLTIEYTIRQRMIESDIEIYNNGVETIGNAIGTFIMTPFTNDSTKNNENENENEKIN